jgi:hypothetical protein
MAHHAQHAARSYQAAKARRILGLAAVVGAGAVAPGVAHADAADRPEGAPSDSALSGAAAGGLHLYPLAGTPLDLLSNNVRVPVGGMDVSTFPLTAPFRDGLPLGEVPVVGSLLP